MGASGLWLKCVNIDSHATTTLVAILMVIYGQCCYVVRLRTFDKQQRFRLEFTRAYRSHL